MTYSFRTNGNFIDFVHTDNTSLQVESVLRSLHNTSRAVSWSYSDDDDRINFKVDDLDIRDFLISEIDFDGTAMDSQDDFETGITAMFTGLAGGGSPGGSSYLVYTAWLTQSGTSAPIATELENTIGAILWTRNGVGEYSATLAGAFTANKTVCPPFDDFGSVVQPMAGSAPYDFFYQLGRISNDVVKLFCFDNPAWAAAELSTPLSTNKLLIEIRVYQ